MITVALDAMGGDFAPKEQVAGAVQAVNENANIKVVLFGDEARINQELEGQTYNKEQIEVVHAATVIENCEAPVKAIKAKKDSSMVMGLYAVRNGEADAFVSCGNTGALLVGGQVIVGKAKGVERPGLAFIVPSLTGPVMIMDCGANVDARPTMLVQFARMATVYMREIMGIASARVGIVSNGEEEEKGNQLVKDTIPLLKECEGINFVGSVESRGIPNGAADIVVCDAFVGNVILKMYEGVAGALLKQIKGTLMSNLKTKIGAALIKKDLKKTLKQFSIEEYGGAVMLGLKAPVVKPHGSSEAVEIKNTILQCEALTKADVASKIEKEIYVEETTSQE